MTQQEQDALNRLAYEWEVDVEDIFELDEWLESVEDIENLTIAMDMLSDEEILHRLVGGTW